MQKKNNSSLSHKRSISFSVNAKKTIEVILWFCSQNKTKQINIYNVLKSIFYAEVEHLNKYGRPIVGDNYIAMDYGTVPSFTYDLIKNNELALNKHGINDLPFSIKGRYIVGTRDYDGDFFSNSDLECLTNAFDKYGKLSFDELKNVNHEHPAWKKARENSPDGPISFELLIEDKEVIEELSQVSSHLVF